MSVAAHILLCDATSEILFLRRAHTGYADGQWSLPAGHVEQGESLPAACVRETVEETGILVASDDLTCVLVQHKHDLDGEERIDVFFRAVVPDNQEPRIIEHHRCDALRWASPHRPPEPTVPYIAAALNTIGRTPTVVLSCFGFDELRGSGVTD